MDDRRFTASTTRGGRLNEAHGSGEGFTRVTTRYVGRWVLQANEVGGAGH